MKNKKTKQQFVSDAIKVHGNKYDYSKVEYKGCCVNVVIICRQHGCFNQTPSNHLSGRGCKKCRTQERTNLQRKSQEDFVTQAKSIHGGKYNYDKTIYVNKRSKVCITCPKHGDFWQNAQSHLHGCGCRGCMKDNLKISYENFIERAHLRHGNKYDYSLITKEKFQGASSYVNIICPEHGKFRQIVCNHLYGKGCKKCANIITGTCRADTKGDFVNKAIAIHGAKYTYDKVEYHNQGVDICITCDKHGDFWQRPSHHLNGSGCPMCKRSTGEEKVAKILNEYNIFYEPQKCFINDFMFCANKHLYVDFFIPSHNIAIEFNGIQHYKPINFFGGESQFDRQQQRDMALRVFCKEHNIKLIEIPYSEYDCIDSILHKALNKSHKNK